MMQLLADAAAQPTPKGRDATTPPGGWPWRRECMDDAAIHTIDAWCQRMLREHAFDSGNLFDETLEADESQRLTGGRTGLLAPAVLPACGARSGGGAAGVARCACPGQGHAVAAA